MKKLTLLLFLLFSSLAISQKQIKVTATAYYAHKSQGGTTTALGTKVRKGVISVDPKVIPLGTKVHVQGYGYAIAEDTGSKIKGKRIDIVLMSRSQCMRFGRRKLIVTILKKK